MLIFFPTEPFSKDEVESLLSMPLCASVPAEIAVSTTSGMLASNPPSVKLEALDDTSMNMATSILVSDFNLHSTSNLDTAAALNLLGLPGTPAEAFDALLGQKKLARLGDSDMREPILRPRIVSSTQVTCLCFINDCCLCMGHYTLSVVLW